MPPPSSPYALGNAATSHSRADGTSPTPTPLVESKDLLRGSKAVGILHNGALYRLQATRLGKLILTK